ncbi:CRIB domain-containing protein RIC6-like [Primulina tabacum]|uniref:CRIB domain-containing protein RIC6-like n=1 Tax=Primulina tabacum TaxID=48773 RepID=UPI003F5AABF0
MKGLLKSLKYISQIFEEEKEKEMQIGLPTDVKHVAHIGSDGPSTNDPPSWMKEFKSGSVFQSAPLGPPEDLGDDSEIKWVSQDSRSGKRDTNSESRDPPDLPKDSRHISSTDNTNDSPRKKDSSTKSRQSRRNHQSKDPLDNKSNNSNSSNTKSSNRHAKESTNSAPHTLRDVPKKSHRMNKSKESVTDSGDTSSRSRSKATTCDGGVCTNPYMDPGHDTGSTLQKSSSRSSSIRF